MSDDLARLVVETHKRAAGFANDMRRQGIHVGLGNNPPVCVTCGQPWPCDNETGEATDDPPDPNEARRPEVEAVMNALMPLGYEPVVICADGSEPCASLEVDGGWLDVTVTYREGGDRG